MSAVVSQSAPQAAHELRSNSLAGTVNAQNSKQASSASTTQAKAYGDVKTKLSFLSPEAPREKGQLFFWAEKAPEGQPQTTVTTQEQEVTVHDLRKLSDAERRKAGFVTDYAGFEIVEGFGNEVTRQPWAEEKWDSEEWITSEYYKDVDALLKKRFGATSTFIFDHTLRKRDPNADDTNPNQRQPVNRAHIDQSAWAGLERVRIHLGEDVYERAKANQGKDTGLNIKLVNVWRPLRDNSDNDWPLAVGDYRTFSDDDLVVAELRYPQRTGETLSVLHSNKQHYHYLSSHRADEATLLKCWDLKDNTKTPHTAFEHSGATQASKPRWSIEVRTLVVIDPEADKQE